MDLQAQTTVDTLVCGDTLAAFYDPIQGGQATDSFYVWLGNCQQVVRFDFTTADIPDGADIYYLDLAGNMTSAGSMPYFGGNCTGANYFTNPVMFPSITALDPMNCLPGFVEIYGRGIPLEDSMARRFTLPTDFMLSGTYQESARLHLKIPPGIVAVVFVIKYNPNAYTILDAIWDCTPQCCIEAIGDTICVGEDIYLDTDREADAYLWSGPNGFSSSAKSPIIQNASGAQEGWYVLEGIYPFGCVGLDSVYVMVHTPTVTVNPPSSTVCLGDSVLLSASGASAYQWMAPNGLLPNSGNQIWASTADTSMFMVIGTDNQGCSDSSYATIMLQELMMQTQGQDPACLGATNGSITAYNLNGQAPYQIRAMGGNWQSGLTLTGLGAGSHDIEVQDATGCIATETIILTDPTSLSLLPTGNDPSCPGQYDGQLIGALPNGQAPFQIRIAGGTWQNGTTLTSLPAGLHFIEMQDALGCQADTFFQLNDPQPMQLSPSGTNPSCPGESNGSITIAVQQGQAPYQIRLVNGPWQTGTTLNGLNEGIHFLEVQDQAGCVASSNYSLTDPPLLMVTSKTTNPSCANTCDGVIQLFPSGGTAPYSFRMDGVTTDSTEANFCEGTYLVEVIDAHGCSWIDTLSLISPSPVEASLQQTDPSCPDQCDGQISIAATGGSGSYSFFLNGNAGVEHNTDLCSGVYQIEVLDTKGCPWSSQIVLETPAPIQGSIEISSPSCTDMCDAGLAIQVNGGVAPFQYFLNQSLSDSIPSDLCADSYQIAIEDDKGCRWDTTVSIQNPAPLAADLRLQDPSCQGFCDGEIEVFTQGGTAPFSYVINGAPQTGPSANGFCPGEYHIFLADARGCDWHTAISLEEVESFEVEVATSPPSCQGACDGAAAMLPLGGIGPYIYSIDQQVVDSVWEALCAGSHTLEVIDVNGCQATRLFSVEPSEEFSIELGETIRIKEGEKANLSVQSSHPIQEVIWSGLCEEGCENEFSYRPDKTELVIAHAISEHGCQAIDSVWVNVYKELACEESVLMPNAFSPNGDGVNDQFTLYAQSDTDIYLISRLIIFNRWGKAVFDQTNLTPNDLSQGWDGYSFGSASPEGTYSWAASFLRSNGDQIDCSGNVILIR